VAEVRARLERAELPADEVEAAIGELTELGYLDDARYARVFAEDKRNLEDWGSDRIEQVLRHRGIDRGLIASALAGAEAEAEGEYERAFTLLRRRFPQPSEEPRERERALGVLIRKGYDSELAYDAVRAWSSGTSSPD
jgi:regulatory protein